MPCLEIFSQGDEVVTGQVVDSNAAWLAQQAIDLGFQVTRHTAVGDNLNDLITLLKEIAQRADCCLCTGGLGPTSDDLTAEAVSLAFDLPLILDNNALSQIERYFNERQRTMPDSNRKQALLPKGSIRLNNAQGTAPGFALLIRRCWFVFMPGVPSEMKAMYQTEVAATLQQRFLLQPKQLITLRTVGIGESALQELLNQVSLPENVQLGFRAELGEVQTKLLFPSGFSDTEKTTLIQQIAQHLGDYLFAIDDSYQSNNNLITVLNELMIQGSYTLVIQESISCGLISSLCFESDWLIQACYQAQAIDLTALEQYAKQLQQNTEASFALIQTYTGDKHAIIHLHTLLQTPEQSYHNTQTIAGHLKRKQHQAAICSLDLLRRYLQHKL